MYCLFGVMRHYEIIDMKEKITIDVGKWELEGIEV